MGFQWRRRILSMVVLTRENGAVAREVRHLGGSGACPPRKFWVSDLLRSFLVQSGGNRDRYSLGIYLNMDG